MTYPFAAFASTIFAALLSTERGKAWVDRNTTAAVILGVGGVLVALRGVIDRASWLRVAGMFGLAGAPLIVRGVWRRRARVRALL